MKSATIRSGAALLGFCLMVGGIALESGCPRGMIVGGVVVLLVSIVGEMRSK